MSKDKVNIYTTLFLKFDAQFAILQKKMEKVKSTKVIKRKTKSKKGIRNFVLFRFKIRKQRINKVLSSNDIKMMKNYKR